MKIPASFFNRPTKQVAKDLLGCYLISKTPRGIAMGKIVETEAYLSNDPASHSFNGQTKRNAPMFSYPGTIYIYFTYGMYNCFNIATREKGIGEAVLIRALEPIKGIELMKERRKTNDIKNLSNGPAKLVIALSISKDLNASRINSSSLAILKKDDKNIKIAIGKRIGITKGASLPLRFFIKDSPFVSTFK